MVPFGHFSLVDLRGEEYGAVIIAPGRILLQRAPDAAVHDLSYLVVWSRERAAAISRELALLAEMGRKVVDATTPELMHVLRAIAPATTPLFRRGGQCRKLFAERQLKAALRTMDVLPARKTAG
jgi:hypothetical protein